MNRIDPLGKFFAVVVFASLCGAVCAEEGAPAGQKREAASTPVTATPAPAPVEDPYVAPYDNGFYTTLAGYNSMRPCKCTALQPMCLTPHNFADSVTVQTITQPTPAPLVVLLLGAEGKALDKIGKQWAGWLSDAGYHVLTFDSTLRSDFVTNSGRGVTGCIKNEAECVRDLIAAYIASPEAQGKVTHVGLVGISYGSIQSLMIAKMSLEKGAPFKVDAVKAFSPPLDMAHAGENIDKWWREDRWNYSLAQLYFTVGRHKPVAPGSPVPFKESIMRAAMAASFRLDLADIVERNDAQYHLGMLPKGMSENDRHDIALGMGFTYFLQNFTYPYWKDRLHLNSIEEMNADSKLINLLPQVPANAEVVISDDDPLNDPAELDRVSNVARTCKLTILHGGGHAGYINACWTRKKLLSLFK